MATDKSEPRNGIIAKVAVVAIATLVVVRAGLVTYFDRIASAEEHRKLGEAKPAALLGLREDEKARLYSGPLPIDKAMQQIAAKGRQASPEISPTASKDLAPLQGWVRMPAQVPTEMTAEPLPAAPAFGADAAKDAGAAATTIDGAVPKAATPVGSREGGVATPKGLPKPPKP
jgi:hypothetical protein